MSGFLARGHLVAAQSALTIHLSDLAISAASINGSARILRREPDDKVSLEIAREDLKSARRTLDLMMEAIDVASTAVNEALGSAEVVDINASPASFRPVGEIGGAVVGRLVPRPAPVKSAGAMGTTSPTGGEAA